MDELQNEVKKKVEQFDFNWSTYVQYIHLIEEVGELGEALTVHSGDRKAGEGTSALADHNDPREEIGDVIFTTVAIANELGINLSEIMKVTFERYERKLARLNSSIKSDTNH